MSRNLLAKRSLDADMPNLHFPDLPPPRSRRHEASWLRTLLVLSSLGLSSLASAQMPNIAALKQLSLEELMNIEVTSVSRYPELLAETASAIQVVTQDQIRRSGATNLPQALRLAHNLNVAQKNAHDWGVTARGFNTELANKLLVLVDGRTVYTPLYSGVFWNVQDYLLEDLDRIEAISGPGGTLWGANAVNGVINILSKSARDTQGLYVTGATGSQLRGLGALRYGGALAPNVHFRLYGKYADRDSEILSNGSDPRDDWHHAQGGFRLDAETGDDDTLTLQGDLYSGEQGVVTGGRSDVSGGNLLGRWSRTLADGSGFRLQVYYDHTYIRIPFPGDAFGIAPAGTLIDELDTYDLDFQHRWHPHERHVIVWGTNFRVTNNDVTNAPAVALEPASLDRALASVFAQDDITLRDDLVFTIGTKIEHNDYTGYEFEPNVRLRWQAAPGHTLWGAISRAVRTPSRIDRHLVQPPGPINILRGNPNFDSEELIAYEIGYRTQLGTRATASVSAFFNDYAKLRSTNFTPATVIPLFFENDLEGETHGVELAVTFQATDRWRLHGGYNFLDGDLRLAPGGFDINNGLNETADPEHQFSLRSSWDLPGNFEFDAGFRWIDSLTVNNGGAPVTVPSYHELDLRLGWHVNDNLELSVVGQNLLHRRHPEYGVPGPTRVEIRRSVYAKLAWRY